MLKTIERAAKQATIFLKVMDEALPMEQKMLFLVDPDSEELYDLYNILGHSVEDLSNMDDDDLAEELYEMYGNASSITLRNMVACLAARSIVFNIMTPY